MANVILSEIVLILHASGPAVTIDREFLEKLARGGISALTEEDLTSHGMTKLEARVFGSNPIDTDDAVVARLAAVRSSIKPEEREELLDP